MSWGPWPAPEEPLALAGTFLGFRFRVWMLSFFIARGLGTWQRQAGVGGWSLSLLTPGADMSSQPRWLSYCPGWCFPPGGAGRSHPTITSQSLRARGAPGVPRQD